MPATQENGIYLALIPDYGVKGILVALDIHLVNAMATIIDYEYDLLLDRQVEESYEGSIDAGDLIHMGSIYFEQLNAAPEIQAKFFFEEHGKEVVLDKSIKPKAKTIHAGPRFCALLNEEAFLYELHKATPAPHHHAKPGVPKNKLQLDIELLKHHMTDNFSGRSKYDISEASYEIDLHFDALVKDESGYNGAEKLQLQLDTFNKKLESAIANGLHSMIVIHGVGTGRLKQEIINIVKQHPKVKSYGPSFERKYGFGATEIFF
ncbi:MAG: Smr/MutS family protein [Chitinophagales bacterium]|nr:Smr/MutS family protein [Chitinophagales bacterium]